MPLTGARELDSERVSLMIPKVIANARADKIQLSLSMTLAISICAMNHDSLLLVPMFICCLQMFYSIAYCLNLLINRGLWNLKRVKRFCMRLKPRSYFPSDKRFYSHLMI